MCLCVCIVMRMLGHTCGGQRTTTGYSFILFQCGFLQISSGHQNGWKLPLLTEPQRLFCNMFQDLSPLPWGWHRSLGVPLSSSSSVFPSVKTSGIYNTISFFPLEHEHGEVRDLARYYLLSYSHCLGQSKCAVSISWAAGRGNIIHLGINKITNFTYFHLN